MTVDSLRRYRSVLWFGLVVVTVLTVFIAARSADSDVAADSPSQVVAPSGVYDPVAAGATLPDGYRIGLDRDQIAPVYNPEFVTAAETDWPADSLVIGIAGAETAKAYPVTHLNSREMVIDSLDGIPILVTW